MIAFDTNVLLRLTVLDDARQAKEASAIVERAIVEREEIYINPVVLSEFIWTLDRSYRANRRDMGDAVRQFLDCPPYRMFDIEVVKTALDYFENSRADFSDCLIGAMNGAVPLKFTYTFDKAASSLEVFLLPPKV